MAARCCSVWLTSLVLLAAGCSCTRFNPILQNNTVKYVCTGSPAIFPWTVDLDPGAVVEDVQWLFRGPSEQMIAFYTFGNFLPTPSFAGRVKALPTNAGIALQGLAVADSGTYTVIVTVRDSATATQFILESMVTLVVTDSVLTSGQLEVKQQPQAVYSTDTQGWALELTCGQFVFGGHTPPLQVEWTDPTGQPVPSSSYHNGFFHLRVASPVKDGAYTCRILPSPATCQHALHHQEGQVRVDGVAARVVVLEAEEAELKRRNVQLRNNASSLGQANQRLSLTLSDLEQRHEDLVQRRDSLKLRAQQLQAQASASAQALADLLTRVQDLEALHGQHHSALPHTPTPTDHTPQGLLPPDLDTQLSQLNSSATQCCQEREELVLNNSRLRELSAELWRDLGILEEKVHSSAARWERGRVDLSGTLTEVDGTCGGSSGGLLYVRLQDLGMLVNETTQAGQVLSRRVQDLENSVVHSGMGGGGGTSSGDVTFRLDSVERGVSLLESRHTKTDVSFHARMASTNTIHHAVTVADDQHLRLFTVIDNNRGGAYDPATGVFSTPVSGTYFFAASFAAPDREHSAQVSLMLEQEEVSFGGVYSSRHYEAGTVHAVLQLRQGQRVWLKNRGDSVYYTRIGAFSGALLRLSGV